MIEEEHCYPFGLTMAGISSKAAGGLINKKGYNGNELQNKEFGDGSGLELYDFNARTYDQQIGRFIQIDPVSEEGDQECSTPYHFGFNNPIRYNDPSGKYPPGFFPAIPFVLEGLYYAGVAVVSYFTAKAAAPIIEQTAQNVGKALSQAPETNIVMGSPFMMGTASYTPTEKKVPNPEGAKGKPDHQEKVRELEKKAQSEAKPGETVLKERKAQGQESNRRPDVQIVDKDGKTRKVFEAERKPNSQRNQKREEEYKKLKVEQETHKVGG